MPDFYSFGLIGYPLEHSLSPRIHMAALQELGLAGEYRLYPIDQPSALQNILEEMRMGKIDGLNVTIPYKNEIMPLLDTLTPTAQEINAVNTISVQDGMLVGDNTDAWGFLADLERLEWAMINKLVQNALVLGAGGSAQAVVYALVNVGWWVTVAARRLEQAVSLVAFMQSSIGPELITEVQGRLSAIKLDRESITNLNPNPSLIINTTPVGMYPQLEASPWPAGLDFPSQAVIYDLVYNPAETVMVREARSRGLQAVNGIGMLVEQAALSLERWTGLRVPRQVMHQAVVEYSAGMK